MNIASAVTAASAIIVLSMDVAIGSDNNNCDVCHLLFSIFFFFFKHHCEVTPQAMIKFATISSLSVQTFSTISPTSLSAVNIIIGFCKDCKKQNIFAVRNALILNWLSIWCMLENCAASVIIIFI